MRHIKHGLIALLTLGLSTILPADTAASSEAGMITRQAAEAYFKAQNADEMSFRSLYVDRIGQAHARYDQLHQGIPVFAGQTIVHVALQDGEVIGVTDANRNIGPLDTKPSITAKTAARLAKKAQGLRGRLQAESKLVIYVTEQNTHLVWHVNLTGLDQQGTPVDWISLIDAHNTEVLLSYDNLHTKREDPPGQGEDNESGDTGDPVIGAANTLYFGTVALATEVYEDGSFGMRDPIRGGNYTTDMLDKRIGDGELFIDDDNAWGDSTNFDRATVGADAHFSASITWDYYLNMHGREGIADDGNGVLSRVHFGRDYVNAFWSDRCQCVTYGDGDGVTADPLVSIDIVAHELTHGITSATATLIYTGESGGLNESMSDIFATAAEFYVASYSETTPDYWLGEDVWTPGIPGDALRYMDDPTRDGVSIDHYSDFTPQMDVHWSSGLANHVFYLMSEGGPHASTGEPVTAIGRDKAEQVFYRALNAYMTPDTNFSAAKAATEDAAMDLYGSETAQLVADAWEACGVQ
jgi:Zn-dependent metalloprotease